MDFVGTAPRMHIVEVEKAAVGTFIGCIWANESWGTYWGWDAKQVWSLIIILAYGLVLHLKFIPKMQSHLTFNIASVISFSSVIMTFVGVNYYFTKGLHSYASDDPPIFPLWAWVTIIALLLIMTAAVVKDNYSKSRMMCDKLCDPSTPTSSTPTTEGSG